MSYTQYKNLKANPRLWEMKCHYIWLAFRDGCRLWPCVAKATYPIPQFIHTNK